jgi:hypothetical protein
MEIPNAKTKVLTLQGKSSVSGKLLNGHPAEQVSTFKYL